MKIYKYIKENGIKHTLEILYTYKIDLLLKKSLGLILKKRPLKDIIVIESHNDFDSNGGAFYEYLIKHGYNEKYKIVWLLKNPLNRKLPENVTAVPLHKPNVRKNYYKWIAKWFTSDNDCSEKMRHDQISIYFGHGGFGLKNCKGYIKLPENIDYVAMPSHFLTKIFSDQLMLKEDDPRLCYIGFPYVDNFYEDKKGDFYKITKQHYSKVILWMPTFRNGGGYKRQDSMQIGKLGIPLIYTMEEYYKLNDFLKSKNIFLILKIHPMQNLEDLKIRNASNICVLTGKTVKKLSVDNYRLMKDCDALISDYSSAAFDFLHCNKPIAYDFSDIHSYKLGLCVKNPHEYMAGNYIKSVKDLMQFIQEVSENNDSHYEERQVLRRKIFDYYDGDNCKRAIELLKITK